jgi:hypothetical protein
MSKMLHRVARAIMESRGGCNVADWREAEWNPHIARVLAEARAAIQAMAELDDDVLENIASSYVAQTWNGGTSFEKWDEADRMKMKERMAWAISYAFSKAVEAETP